MFFSNEHILVYVSLTKMFTFQRKCKKNTSYFCYAMRKKTKPFCRRNREIINFGLKKQGTPVLINLRKPCLCRYDLPAMLRHVMKVTGQDRFYYIGHSMGTLSYYTACNYNPWIGIATSASDIQCRTGSWDTAWLPCPTTLPLKTTNR